MSLNPDAKVLVVDDFPSVRRIIRFHLKTAGFENVEEAENGRGALAKLKKDDYGLIITDWNMPDIDGLELARIMKQDSRLKDILIMMITAVASEENVRQAIEVGVNDYLLKPFTADAFLKKLETVIA